MPSPSPSTPSPHSSTPNLLAPPQPSPPPLPSSPPAASQGVENEDPNQKPSFNPRLSFAGTSGQDGRRPSVQFLPSRTGSKGRSDSPNPADSPKPVPSRIQRRLSSPPPPSKYERRVSFNTFDNPDATDCDFHIGERHQDYNYTQRSRTFLCGTDDNEYSYDAVEWLIEELVEDGDNVICLRVVDKDSKFASDASIQKEVYKKESEQLLAKIQKKNKAKEEGEKEKGINIVVEFAVGKVPEVFQRMINIYTPACLIVGTKGKSPVGMNSFITGSVSRYCLQNSPVPCIVVRPTHKRIAKKRKRLADEKRRNYANVVELSGARGSQMVLNPVEGLAEAVAGGTGAPVMPEASEKEAQAVAAAIGLPRSLSKAPVGPRRPTPVPDDEGAPLSRPQSAKTESVGADSPSPTGAYVVSGPNSPEFEPLDDDTEISISDAEGYGQTLERVHGRGGGGGGESADEERRGRTRSQESRRGNKTGAKTFMFPKERRKSEGSG
ncbi:MAG: hypothetical protein Q9184_006206 [Pyrenodesmia sp. 2 TL-2023]